MRRVYLDYNATTPIHEKVKEAMIEAMEIYGNASSHHSFGQESRKLIENSRKIIADSLNASPDEIIFTSCGSESNNLVLKGATCGNTICKIGSGKSGVVVSAIEHPSVLNTAKCLKGEGKATKFAPVDENGVVKVDELEKLITDEVGLVSIMYANNEIGTIQPIEEISKLTADKGVQFHTDAVQAFGKLPIDVKELNLDFLTLSGHKIYGPKGIGVLYKKKKRRVCPLIHGGHHEFNLRAGTENTVAIVGLAKAVELAMSHMDNEWKRIEKLRDWFESEVEKRIPFIQINGKGVKRLAGTSNISFQYIEGEAILYDLDFSGIAVSTGSACSSGSLDPSHVMLAMGRSHGMAHGSMRFSIGKDTTMEDMEYTVNELVKIVERLRNISPFYKKAMETGK